MVVYVLSIKFCLTKETKRMLNDTTGRGPLDFWYVGLISLVVAARSAVNNSELVPFDAFHVEASSLCDRAH